MADFIMAVYLCLGIIKQQDYYDWSDDGGNPKYSSWQMIKWLWSSNVV